LFGDEKSIGRENDWWDARKPKPIHYETLTSITRLLTSDLRPLTSDSVVG